MAALRASVVINQNKCDLNAYTYYTNLTNGIRIQFYQITLIGIRTDPTRTRKDDD